MPAHHLAAAWTLLWATRFMIHKGRGQGLVGRLLRSHLQSWASVGSDWQGPGRTGGSISSEVPGRSLILCRARLEAGWSDLGACAASSCVAISLAMPAESVEVDPPSFMSSRRRPISVGTALGVELNAERAVSMEGGLRLRAALVAGPLGPGCLCGHQR